MTALIWICIVIDAIIALFLITMLANPNQDAAGKGMLALPIILLLICALCAWLLMNRNYRVAALITSAIPAVISVYVAFLTFRN